MPGWSIGPLQITMWTPARGTSACEGREWTKRQMATHGKVGGDGYTKDPHGGSPDSNLKDGDRVNRGAKAVSVLVAGPYDWQHMVSLSSLRLSHPLPGTDVLLLLVLYPGIVFL